jgi:hypothetical protein
VTCLEPNYWLAPGTWAWVVCELDDSDTAPRAPRAWPICRRCCACPLDGWPGGRCPGPALGAPRCAPDVVDLGPVVYGAAGRPVGRVTTSLWCEVGR